MDTDQKEIRPTRTTAQLLIWYILGAIASIAIGWIAAILHLSGHAPIGILSLGVGLALGAALICLAGSMHVSDSKRLVVGAILLAILAVLAEHAWLYRDFRRQWHDARAKSPQVAMFRPESPWSPSEYFAHEITLGRAALWCVDAALVAGATVGTVAAARRLGK